MPGLYEYLLTHPYGEIDVEPVQTPFRFYYRPDFTDTSMLASGLPTAALGVGTRCDVLFNSVLVEFLLAAGPADPDDPGQVAPDDYDPDTNDKHWQQMGGG